MSIADMWNSATELRHFRVWMTIRGSVSKPTYDGKCDVWAIDEDDAFQRAIAECQRTAHWDSPASAFRLDKVEPIA